MLFNSYVFILFLGIILAVYYLPVAWKTKKISLLLAGYLFYAMWNPPFVLLLWLSTVVDFIVGRRLYHAEGRAKRQCSSSAPGRRSSSIRNQCRSSAAPRALVKKAAWLQCRSCPTCV